MLRTLCSWNSDSLPQLGSFPQLVEVPGLFWAGIRDQCWTNLWILLLSLVHNITSTAVRLWKVKPSFSSKTDSFSLWNRYIDNFIHWGWERNPKVHVFPPQSNHNFNSWYRLFLFPITPPAWGPTHAGFIRLQDLFMFVGAVHYPGGWIFQDSIGVVLGLHFHLAVTEVKGGKKGQMSKLGKKWRAQMTNDTQQWPGNQNRCHLNSRKQDGLIQCSKNCFWLLKTTYETGFCSECACHNYRCRALINFTARSSHLWTLNSSQTTENIPNRRKILAVVSHHPFRQVQYRKHKGFRFKCSRQQSE